DVDALDHRPQALLVASARRRRGAADVRGVGVVVLFRVLPHDQRRREGRLLHAQPGPGESAVARRVRRADGRAVRRGDRVAHGGRRHRRQGRRRSLGDPGLARLDCARADGAGLRAARRRRLLHVHRPSARCGAQPPSIKRMSGTNVGFIIFGVMLALMVVRVPIGIAMFSVGAAGYVYMTSGNVNALLNSLKNLAYARLSNYDLVVIPLFLLMGQFATHGGLSRALFRCVSAFLGHRKGGIAMAAVGACAGFGAICGSSLATAATMGQVALPEWRRFGYSGSRATGARAAGGTLGIMIPPSVPLVIYAILTQESIGKLFMAAVLPGIIAMLGDMRVIQIIVRLKPGSGPAGPEVPWGEKFRSLFQVFPVVLV